jgi:hypothetical protein
MIEKVQTLQRQARGGTGFPGRPGGRGDRPQGDRQQTDVEKKAEALQMLVWSGEATTEEIKATMAVLREARAKAKAEVEAAQKELREVVTVPQEAILTAMGVLD